MEHSGGISKSIKLTNTIVNAYIHDMHVLCSSDHPEFNIPNEIVRLILLFLENYYSTHGLHTWNVIDESIVHKMLTADNSTKFISEPFIMSRCKWQFEIYPNGDKPH